MARQLENTKFKVIEGEGSEFLAIGLGGSNNVQCGTIDTGIFAGFSCINIEGGQYLVCDDCCDDIKKSDICYYVAVLNRLFCKNCYEQWVADATYYQEDAETEFRNYALHQRKLERQGLWQIS